MHSLYRSSTICVTAVMWSIVENRFLNNACSPSIFVKWLFSSNVQSSHLLSIDRRRIGTRRGWGRVTANDLTLSFSGYQRRSGALCSTGIFPASRYQVNRTLTVLASCLPPCVLDHSCLRFHVAHCCFFLPCTGDFTPNQQLK